MVGIGEVLLLLGAMIRGRLWIVIVSRGVRGCRVLMLGW